MDAIAIRNELRQGNSPALDARRKVILLSALGLVDFSIISLYQTGVIKHLPDPRHPIFDSDKINASEDAYQFGAPDGPISAAAYAIAMIFASAGGSERTGRKPALDVALGATVAGNAIGAIYYLGNMIFKQKKICLYCVTGAAINIASAIIIAPAVLRSIKKLVG
ncbi:MAG TPA: vitamin K epoxide reductase family protein [Chryseosolibacter sp.]|nr:vitamin K epoxide reductase family protein [Chryseosolibacter sp.]